MRLWVPWDHEDDRSGIGPSGRRLGLHLGTWSRGGPDRSSGEFVLFPGDTSGTSVESGSDVWEIEKPQLGQWLLTSDG